MRNCRLIVIVLFLSRFWQLNAQSSTFRLTDTTFQLGAICRIEPEFRFPSCTFEDEDYYAANMEAVDAIVAFLGRNPTIKVEIGIHTDFRSGTELNEDLSMKRAEAIRNILVHHGADSSRIIPKGYGEGTPVSVWLKDGSYSLVSTEGVEKIELTESYINQFKLSNTALYQRLMSYLRRTELCIIAIRE